MARYYKVVSAINDNKFCSAFAEGASNVEYKIGKKSKPNKGFGPLLAFETLAEAREFSPHGIILAGKGKKTKLRTQRLCWDYSINEMINFWQNKTGKYIWYSTNKWPDGTIGLEWFCPERIVQKGY